MILLIDQFEAEPFIKLAEDAHEGNVNKTWQVDPIAVFVVFFIIVVIEPLDQSLRPDNGKHAKAAKRKSQGQLHFVSVLESNFPLVPRVWIQRQFILKLLALGC